MDFGIATVVAITVMCYIVGLIVRATSLDNKWIPVTCGVAGLLLGIAALYIGMPMYRARPATRLLPPQLVRRLGWPLPA